MTKGAKRDWAERTAKRVLSNDELTLGFGSNSVEDIAALAKLLRRAEKRGYERGAKMWNESLLSESGTRERDRSEG